ncbi:MAG: hypothetical protein A3D92_04325, partial [Bacteroidetes bacterium RIFCSPHIGHO2_02_FULL_44_7]
VVLNGAIGLIALLLDSGTETSLPVSSSLKKENPPDWNHFLAWISFFSGFLTLGLEVLWTHMFALVLQNSVYTFTAILMVYLTALALGAAVASYLSRFKMNGLEVLFSFSLVGGIAVGLTPLLFRSVTNDLGYLSIGTAWPGYISSILFSVFLILGLPVLLIGTVFPYLLKMAENDETFGPANPWSAEKTVGRLCAFNTLGAISGSLAAGFFLLKFIGLWKAILLCALIYILTAFLISLTLFKSKKWFIAVPVLALVALIGPLNPSFFPLFKVDSKKNKELIKMWEGPQGIVSVVREGKDLELRINNLFGLGGSKSRGIQMAMADLPIMIHPNPESVLFLGMGTGFTAGGALDHDAIKKITVTELVDEVAQAAKEFFAPSRLFEDPRVKIVVEDARNYLLGTNETYDLIISDLFFPWEAGAGNLYTREHFERIASRLNEDGIFALWLPFYQLSRQEFSIIAKTMLDVFPSVTLWRADFFTNRPTVGLFGMKGDRPLSPDLLTNRFLKLSQNSKLDDLTQSALPFMKYAGNLTAAHSFFDSFSLNTDDHPVIEFLAPIS